jgi:hypothetical protein
MDLAWAVENGQRHDSALELSRVELGLLLFTPKPSTLLCRDAVLLPIPYAANHWPATAFAPAQPESRPACTYHRLRLPTPSLVVPLLSLFSQKGPPAKHPGWRSAISVPGCWVRQAVAEGLTKAHELRLWSCSKAIKLCSSVLRIPNTVPLRQPQ